MPINIAPTGLARDLQTRADTGKPIRLGDDESPFVMMIPPMKIRDFTFTSLSDAV